MRLLCWSLLVMGLLALTTLPGSAGDKSAFEVYAKGYFVKNNAPLVGNPAFLILQDKKAYDQIFGIGFVMGAKPKLVDEKLFESQLIVAVIKSGNTPWKYQVEKVRRDKKKLVVEFTATGKESATAKFTVPLILSIPRSDYTDVIFIENGKEAGKQTVTK